MACLQSFWIPTGSGSSFPLQQLNQFAAFPKFKKPISLLLLQRYQHRLPSAPPYSPAWVPTPCGPSAEFRDTSTCQAVPPLQGSDFQLCLSLPLSFCVLIILISFFCSLSPRGGSCSYNYYFHDILDFYFFSYVINSLLYQILSSNNVWFLPPYMTFTDI